MEEELKAPEKKKRGGYHGQKSPVIGNNGLMLNEGDNAKIMKVNMALFNMPEIDKRDVEQVNERLREYFELYFEADMKPTVVGMGMALGMDRRTLWAIANDQPINGYGTMSSLPSEVADSIKKAYKMMENFWESYMAGGKINPVTGIFLGKNNFGYKDQTETILTPNTAASETYSAEDIKSRYVNSKRLSDSHSDSDSDSDS